MALPLPLVIMFHTAICLARWVYTDTFINWQVHSIKCFLQSWRWAYYLIGIPGFVLCIILFFTVKEPKRKAIDCKSRNTQEEEDPASSILNPSAENPIEDKVLQKRTYSLYASNNCDRHKNILCSICINYRNYMNL